jgi:hypothetical protein
LLFFGSWASTGAAYITTTGLKKVGCSEATAKAAGNGVAFAVNVVKNLSPIGVAATVTNYAVAKFAFWAEKRVVQQLAPISNSVNLNRSAV